MSTPHKASAEQWAELRARVEALEVLTNHFRDARNMVPTPASSLVERVAISLAKPGDRTWDEMASDAIREVAAAALAKDLNGQAVFCPTWKMVAQWLEQEANRG